MNKLAVELNKKLQGTVALELLSEQGKRFFFPKGIAAQAGEARTKATRFNATIGMAFEEGKPMMLPSIRNHVPAMEAVEVVSYAPTGGVDELRRVWKEEIVKKNPGLQGRTLSLPAVVSGLTNGIAQIADLFADPGDPVITPDMFWGNYRLIFEARCEASIHNFPFFNDQQGFNVEGLKDTVRRRARNGKAVILLNFPNNPTGYSPTEEEAQAIGRAMKELAEEGFKLLIICDDAYFGLFFEEGLYRSSIFEILADLHPNILSVKIDGATKEDFVWGFRIGFITLNSAGLNEEHLQALNKKITGLIRATISNSNRISQTLLLSALKNEKYVEDKQKNFQTLLTRYRRVKEILKTMPEDTPLKVIPFNSGYFMTFACEGISAEVLRQALLEEGIGTIAIQEDYLRVAFSSIDEENLEALYQAIFAKARELK